MPNLIKNAQVSTDEWVFIEASDGTDALPAGKLIVPLQRWIDQQEQLLARGEEIGIWLDSSESPELIGDQLSKLALIAVNFPAFTDGRGFSYAQILRGRLGFTGELRAIGDVGLDQIFFMKRCGFDTYLLPDDKNVEHAISALNSFSDTYQAAQDQPVPAFRRIG